MSEYVSREDAVKAIRERCSPCGEAIEAIRDAPTVDAVVVTRCKSCKYGEAYDRTDGTKGVYCHCPHSVLHYGNGSIFTPVRENLDFCSYGEPKEG